MADHKNRIQALRFSRSRLLFPLWFVLSFWHFVAARPIRPHYELSFLSRCFSSPVLTARALFHSMWNVSLEKLKQFFHRNAIVPASQFIDSNILKLPAFGALFRKTNLYIYRIIYQKYIAKQKITFYGAKAPVG